MLYDAQELLVLVTECHESVIGVLHNADPSPKYTKNLRKTCGLCKDCVLPGVSPANGKILDGWIQFQETRVAFV